MVPSGRPAHTRKMSMIWYYTHVLFVPIHFAMQDVISPSVSVSSVIFSTSHAKKLSLNQPGHSD